MATSGPNSRARWAVWAAGGAGLLVVAVIVLAFVIDRGSTTRPKPVDFAALPGLQTGTPPWENGGVYLQRKLPFVGLTALTAEGAAVHFHQHLDVFLNGQAVKLPAQIGITNAFITELHTHDSSGIIHIESPKASRFTLGQFFGEWGVQVSSSCLGRYCGRLSWWVNGKPQTGDPALLRLKAHQEIVLAFGKAPAKVPASYPFTNGL